MCSGFTPGTQGGLLAVLRAYMVPQHNWLATCMLNTLVVLLSSSFPSALFQLSTERYESTENRALAWEEKIWEVGLISLLESYKMGKSLTLSTSHFLPARETSVVIKILYVDISQPEFISQHPKWHPNLPCVISETNKQNSTRIMYVDEKNIWSCFRMYIWL